jgi:hypothetical protein
MNDFVCIAALTERYMKKANNINELLDKMWGDYVATNPDAQKIHDIFVGRGDIVLNDHIALRTFDHDKVNIDVLARPLIASGYKEMGTYDFEQKKLFAKHFEHEDINLPTIFISQLLTKEFDLELQEIVNKLVDQVSDEDVARFDFTSMGRPWECSTQDYTTLKKHTEYAAWLGAFGYRPNHFTVFINHLNSLDTVEQLNELIKSEGYALNSSGGEVKGSKEVLLEQSSTLAKNVKVQFSDSELEVPSTYYEFAKRYPLENGELYQGFVAKSADKIFESTDQGQ